MLVLVLWVALAAALFYYFIVKPYDYWKNIGVKQGKPVWILGDSWGSVLKTQSFAEMVSYVYNQCPGVRYSGMYQFFQPVLVLKDPDLLKQIAVKDFEYFTDRRSFVSEDADPFWSRNLASLRGQKWHDMRAILSPSFTASKMRAMFVLIADCAENFVQHFLKNNENIAVVEMKDTLTRFTNDVIATTAFGIEVDSLGEPNNEFYLMGKELTDITGFRKSFKLLGNILFPRLFSLLKTKMFDTEVVDFFTNVVNETIRVREERGIVRPDMIHLLTEARKKNTKTKHEEDAIIDTGFATAQESDTIKPVNAQSITNEDITAQAMVFFFAGFETVSNLMCFASYELAVNPDIQERLRKEVQDTMKDCGGKLTYEALSSMKYMDMFISESLRKWPSAVAMDRVCTKSYTIQPALPGEKLVHLPKGSVVSYPMFGFHRDPKYFPDPDRFDPERFSDENKANIKPYTYFPFGLGPRNCIGSRFALLETKALFFYMLAHFEIVPVEKTQIPVKMSKASFNMTPDGGLWLGLKRIKV